MKKIFIIVAVILLSAVSFAVLVYYPYQDKGTEISLSIDKTDLFKSKPVADEILSKVDIERNKWAPVTLRINTLSGFDYNTVNELALPGKLMILSNPSRRDNEIAKFKSDFIDRLNAVSQTDIGLPNSCIYGPMVRELNRLSKSQAKRRIAILYGDCRHNMPEFSVYQQKDLELLKQHPEEVRELFEKLEKPGTLTGIEVYFIFEPRTEQENISFKLMAKLFQDILTDAGAKVYIAANLLGANGE
jgi:hypothetical protein